MGLVFGLASKAGFILSLYVCIVPFIAVFIGYKIKGMEIVAAVVALVGVILLTLQEGFTIGVGDSFFLAVAVAFAVYLLAIDYYGRNLPPAIHLHPSHIWGDNDWSHSNIV